jgi:hypothetical protein
LKSIICDAGYALFFNDLIRNRLYWDFLLNHSKWPFEKLRPGLKLKELVLNNLSIKTNKMTRIRKGSFIKSAKDISIGGALALAILSGITMSSCSSNDDDESAYSYEETTYSKGIRSHIKEIKPGEFRITDEENVGADSSMAIVSYLDGHVDTLSTAAAKALIDEEIRTNHSYVGHHSGLSSMLLYGGMGYMLGRNSSNSYMNNYRNDPNVSRGFYSNPATYERSQNVVSRVNASRSTRTVSSRPSGGRKGFFGRSSSRSGG